MRKFCKWHALRRVPNSFISSRWQHWILDRGSLTQRLIRASHGNFKVRLVHQGWDYPALDEAKALSQPANRIAMIREVELLCYGQVWVSARSIIPLTTLSGEERALLELGDKPLGAFLFASRTMHRGPIEVARFSSNQLKLTQQSEQEYMVHGRRSIFYLHDKPLLVSELFLPALLKSSSNPAGLDSQRSSLQKPLQPPLQQRKDCKQPILSNPILSSVS